MKKESKQDKSSAGLIFLAGGYLLTLVIVIILLSTLINQALHGEFRKTLFISILCGFILSALLTAVIIQVIRLFRERRRDEPGIHIKFKITLFFVLVIILSSLPFIILSSHLLIQFTEAWYNPAIGEALQSGRDTSLLYYNDITENIQALTRSEELAHIIDESRDSPDDAWKRIKDINPGIDGLQIIIDGKEYFSGKADCYISNPQIESFSPGLLPTRQVVGFSVISGYRRITQGPDPVHIIISDRLPKEFSSESEAITSAFRQYRLFREIANFITPFTISIFIFSALPLLLLSFILSLFLSSKIITPLTSLHYGTKKIADGDFSYRLINRPGNDFSFFIHAFNSMAKELEQSQSRVRQTEKVTAWQEISKRLAHELKNPLTPIKLTAQRILRKTEKEEDPELIREMIPSSMNLIIDEVNRLDLMLLDFRYFANQKEPECHPVDIVQFLKETVAPFKEEAPSVDFRMEAENIGSEIPLDEGLMTQAVGNLLKNSIEALSSVENGSVLISVTLVQKGFKQYSRIRIRDNGGGIPMKNLDEVFQPYFSTKENKLGLGLPTAERIIRSHRGLIWLESDPGKECVLFIDLPVAGS